MNNVRPIGGSPLPSESEESEESEFDQEDNVDIWVQILVKILNEEDLDIQDHDEIGTSHGNFDFGDTELNTLYRNIMKYMHQIYARHMFTNIISSEQRSEYSHDEIIDINTIPHVGFDSIQHEFATRIGPRLNANHGLEQTNYEARINTVINNYEIQKERETLNKWLEFLRKILRNESLSDEDKKYIEDSKGDINFNHISEKEDIKKDIKIIYQVYIRHKINNTPTENRALRKQKNLSIWNITGSDSTFRTFRIDDNIKNTENLSHTTKNSLNIPNYIELINIIYEEYNNLGNGSSESKSSSSSDGPSPSKKAKHTDGIRKSKRRSTRKSKRRSKKSKRRSKKSKKRKSKRHMK
jgi:hypothetical protein